MGYALMLFLLLFFSYDAARTHALENNKQLVVFINTPVPNKLFKYENVVITYTNKPFKLNEELTIRQGVLVSRYHSYNHDLYLKAIFLYNPSLKELLNSLDEFIY